MKQNIALSILTLGHFLIDLACLYFLFLHYPQSGFIAGIQTALLYNFLAFALQVVIGYFFDQFPVNRSTSLGILLIIGGYVCGFWDAPAIGLVFCGCGNAFYHVGGSIGIARPDKKGLRDSGIFVSAGALGVSLGTYLATKVTDETTILINRSPVSTSFCILLLLILLLLLQTQVVDRKQDCKNVFSTELSAATRTVLLLLTLVAVFIRSLGGLLFPTSYRTLFTLPENNIFSVFLLAIASGIAAFLGKFLGGFLSNLCTTILHKVTRFQHLDIRSGNYLFGILTLLSSTLLLTLGETIPLLCFLSILCFHAAMPVTLFELYCILPDHPGFAMGLSTLMLFLGSLPAAFVPMNTLPAPLVLCILTLLAAGCMLLSLLIYRQERSRTSNNKEECP